MSLINTYVNISRAVRTLANSVKKYLIKKLEVELDVIEVQLASAESRRSENMVNLHQAHYDAVESFAKEKEEAWVRICNEYESKLTKEVEGFNQRKAAISVVAQAVADDLKSRRASVSSELDKLTN